MPLARPLVVFTASLATASLAALACDGAPKPAPAGADSARLATPEAAAPAPPAPATGPTLVVGGRYETQPGTVVCPRPAALVPLVSAAQRGDAAAFAKALADGGCSPVVAGATVQVAEQVQGAARVRRAGDTTTYWAMADKLLPR